MSSAAPWQQEILARLQARDVHDRAYATLIDNCKRLAAQTAVLKERNRSLLRAAVSASSSSVPGKPNGQAGNGDNPVRQAYVASLESQVSSLREELSSLYKTQAQNAQRLVHLTEQLQSGADKQAHEHAELVHLRSERTQREREREEALHLRREKDRNIETLQDELGMLKLEFEMLEKRNGELAEDNSSLLRRWLEKKAQEAAEMDRMVAESHQTKKAATKSEAEDKPSE